MSEQFGPYELHERLGQGAMGIVYRARDTQLDRWVAIKILNAVAVADGERLQRFVQEAKVTSSLSHPSITTIHQLSESDARHYIVMELVAGENLRQRLRHGALEIPAVLDLGIQAADGLAAAHAAGIIHRDLKPENMMLRPDGLLKILDFGLAKLVQAHEPGDLFGSDRTSDETILHSPPAASSPTVPGMVLGTVGYMAPEQVRGGLVDHRSDLFALGCVLYELATGTRAWSRESPIETMHAILKEPVRPLHEVRPDAPAELERILRKALAKDPAERYQNARDLAVDLRALRRDLEMVASGATRALHSGSRPAIQSPPRPRRWMRGMVVIGAIIVVAGIAFVLRSVRRDAVTPPGALQITRLTSTGNADWPVLSPDARFVAYVRNDMGSYSIWLRQIATNSESQLIPASERPLGALVFSPDSNWLYYISVDRTTFETPLYRMPVVGGEARLVCDDVDTPISFSPDGKEFVFSRVLPPLASEVYISPADGATPPRRIVERGPDFLSLATWSPDGREIVAAALDTRDVSRVRFAHFTPNGGKVTIDESPVWAGMRGITWIPDGSGYYVAGLLTAQDPTGRVYRVRRRGGVQPITTDLNSYASVSVSADGKFLVSLRSSTTTNFWTMPVTGDAARDAGAAAQIGFGTARIDNPTPSPDGRAIAYSSDAAGATDLWRMNIDGSDARALTSGPASELQPDWSPDGRRLAYTLLDGDSVRVWIINADGTGARQVVFGVQSGAADWGPDSRTIVYHQTRDARSNLWTLDVDTPGATPVRLNEELASFPQWSPDGREILCYTFDGDSATAKPAVAIVPATGGPSRRIPVPFDSDTMARAWSPDGKHITSIRLSDGASNLVEYSITDGTMRPLSQFGGGLRIYAFTWLPGGAGVVLERGTSNRDVVLLQNF